MDCLIKFREQQGMSRREMAKLLGISHSFYEKLELGDREISRAFMEKFKKTFPSFDMNIFFEERLHGSCSEKVTA
ncbi:MAG: helix-turn-helix transcriptional regulator [Selenomonas sp.]|nr:helix-turn-helix transcriptional regulator [Selenomonas sp.]